MYVLHVVEHLTWSVTRVDDGVYTCTHTRTHTHIHTRCSCTSYMLLSTSPGPSPALMMGFTHAHTHTHTHTHTRSLCAFHTLLCVYLGRMLAWSVTRVDDRVHTHTRTHTHTHTHTQGAYVHSIHCCVSTWVGCWPGPSPALMMGI